MRGKLRLRPLFCVHSPHLTQPAGVVAVEVGAADLDEVAGGKVAHEWFGSAS